MANHSLIAVFLAAGICAFLDVVSLVNPSPTPPWAKYHKESENMDFGIKMTYDSTKDKTMTVVISYDTETETASTFFGNSQLAGWIDGFTACKVINFKFNPCTVSKIQDGHLLCASARQCTYDEIHSCVAPAFEDPIAMGKFLVCFFSGHTTTAECIKRGGLDEMKINQCANSGQGAKNCDYFHTVFQDSVTKRMQSEAEKVGEQPNAITDFKGATCWVLAQGNLHCPSLCPPP